MTAESNLPAVIGSSVSPYLKVLLPVLEIKKKGINKSASVSYSISALHFLTIVIVSYTVKWVLLGKLAQEHKSRDKSGDGNTRRFCARTQENGLAHKQS